MHRTIPVLITATAVAIPFAAVSSPIASGAIAHAAASKAVTYKGPAVNMRWGAVQVTIIVQNKKVTRVTATAPIERPRSAYINKIAVPMLVQQVLKAQNTNVNLISGATMTSQAFLTSLQNALKTAHL